MTISFFFGKGHVRKPAAGLRLDDIEFALALIVEALESTAQLNFAIDVAELFLKDGVGRIKPLLVKVANAALEGWFIYANKEDYASKPKIARTVRNTLRSNFKSAWQGRVEDGDTIWNHVLG